MNIFKSGGLKWVLTILVGCCLIDSVDAANWWAEIVGRIVAVVIFIVGAAIFSLIAFCVCGCHEKYRKNQVMNMPGGNLSNLYPAWTKALTYDPRLGDAGFGEISEGFTRISGSHIVRCRKESNVTDGARWGAPMTQGKHFFEIIYPLKSRSKGNACVGVGTPEAALTSPRPCALVGNNRYSVGLNLQTRRVIQNNSVGVMCPKDGSHAPDRLFMLVDMDEGSLGFGNTVTYWGTVAYTKPLTKDKDTPLHVMVSSCTHDAHIQVVYRGSASIGIGGVNPLESLTIPDLHMTKDIPSWAHELVSDHTLQDKGFFEVSSGFNSLSPNHIVRQGIGLGTSAYDGARWSVGITSGKHVFEIIWRWSSRGSSPTVGLGTLAAPLAGHNVVTLVGNNAFSWGFDIMKRRVSHKSNVVTVYPPNNESVPDRFFMFVDMDVGTLGFGTEFTYWGHAVTNLPVNHQEGLYPMVVTSKGQAEVQIHYKGSSTGKRGQPMPPFSTLPPAYFHTLASNQPPPGPSTGAATVVAPPAYEGAPAVIKPAPVNWDNGAGTSFDPPPPYQYQNPGTSAGVYHIA